MIFRQQKTCPFRPKTQWVLHCGHMKKCGKLYLPVLIVQNKCISWHFFPIIIAVPMVECVCPVLYLQCRVPITGFSESRVIWLWISKPAGWMQHLFRTTIGSFPECRIPPPPPRRADFQFCSFSYLSARPSWFPPSPISDLRQWCRQEQIRQLLDNSHHQIHCSVCLRFDTENWKNN
jgi:hypothetical protein